MSWQNILKNLDQQDWYTERDGWMAVPTDESHRIARQLIFKNYSDEDKRKINSIPKDGNFHDVGFTFLGEPVLFKKDETYTPTHRNAPTHFKLTGRNIGRARIFNEIIDTVKFLKSKGVKLNKFPAIMFASKQEYYDYHTKMMNKARELRGN